MIIDGKNVFMGAYEEVRQRPERTLENVDKDLKALVISNLETAAKEMNQRPYGNAAVSISQDTIDFLCSEDGHEKMKKDVEQLLYMANYYVRKERGEQNNGDVFWENTGNQWVIFSEYLYNNEFYSDMDENVVKEKENLLKKITSVMDFVSRKQYSGHMVTFYDEVYDSGEVPLDLETPISNLQYFADMNSSDVRLDLESSTNALRYFADKYVNADKRDQFNQLIDRYYQHNSKVIEGYQGINESMYRQLAVLHENFRLGTPSPVLQQLRPRDKKYDGYQHDLYLGGIQHTAQENKQFQLNIQNSFETIRNNTDKWNFLWNQLKEKIINFVTNNSDDQELKTHAYNKSEQTFSRINDYWSELLIMNNS